MCKHLVIAYGLFVPCRSRTGVLPECVSGNIVAEDSGPVGCATALLGEWFAMCGNVVLLYIEGQSAQDVDSLWADYS